MAKEHNIRHHLVPFFITKHYPNFLKNLRWHVHIIRNKDGESKIYKSLDNESNNKN